MATFPPSAPDDEILQPDASGRLTTAYERNPDGGDPDGPISNLQAVAPGPGWFEGAHTLSPDEADTSIEFTHITPGPGDTVAQLIAKSDRIGAIDQIGVELTRGDLVALRDHVSQLISDLDDINGSEAPGPAQPTFQPLTPAEFRAINDAALSWADELVEYIAPANENAGETDTAINQRENAKVIRRALAKLTPAPKGITRIVVETNSAKVANKLEDLLGGKAIERAMTEEGDELTWAVVS